MPRQDCVTVYVARQMMHKLFFLPYSSASLRRMHAIGTVQSLDNALLHAFAPHTSSFSPQT